jgi:hypothetical protein
MMLKSVYERICHALRSKRLTASDPCMLILKSLTGRDPIYRVLVSERSPVTVSRAVRNNTPFCGERKSLIQSEIDITGMRMEL